MPKALAALKKEIPHYHPRPQDMRTLAIAIATCVKWIIKYRAYASCQLLWRLPRGTFVWALNCLNVSLNTFYERRRQTRPYNAPPNRSLSLSLSLVVRFMSLCVGVECRKSSLNRGWRWLMQSTARPLNRLISIYIYVHIYISIYPHLAHLLHVLYIYI